MKVIIKIYRKSTALIISEDVAVFKNFAKLHKEDGFIKKNNYKKIYKKNLYL